MKYRRSEKPVTLDVYMSVAVGSRTGPSTLTTTSDLTGPQLGFLKGVVPP